MWNSSHRYQFGCGHPKGWLTRVPGTNDKECSGENPKRLVCALETLEKSFDFAALRRVGRQPAEQIICSGRGLGAASGPREGDRQPEARLMEIGIDRQGSLQWGDRIGRVAAVREHEAEICRHDGVSGLDAFGGSQRRGRCREFPLRNLAGCESEMRIG